ncbi:hypothetical protein [uncultured Roseovarius sp.]|uniref:hypothetical protein n=1 Tax=uncultured Roseovarius sp. TaxID=293344 RepID=UPI002605B4CE|nr:hypothetical protein [uncultured Roseovarius sp.]
MRERLRRVGRLPAFALGLPFGLRVDLAGALRVRFGATRGGFFRPVLLMLALPGLVPLTQCITLDCKSRDPADTHMGFKNAQKLINKINQPKNNAIPVGQIFEIRSAPFQTLRSETFLRVQTTR